MTSANVQEPIEELASIFLTRRPSLMHSDVSLRISLRRGRPTISVRRPSDDDRIHRFHLGFDPAIAEMAWSTIGTQSIGTAVILRADEIARPTGDRGAVFAWSGVTQHVGNLNGRVPKLEILRGHALRVGGALVSADNTHKLLNQAERVVELGGAIDWNQTSIWSESHPGGFPGMHFTNVSSFGDTISLMGVWQEQLCWPGMLEPVRRPEVIVVQRHPDGRWLIADSQKPYESWLQDQANRFGVTDEDMKVLARI